MPSHLPTEKHKDHSCGMPKGHVGGSQQWRYGIVLDAGSSGTRLYVYRWLENSHAREIASAEQIKSLLSIETKKQWTKKTKPGISTFGEKPDRVGPDHLKELFDRAQKVVPDAAAQDTPIFLLATAGMRLLPETQRDKILKEVCTYIRSTTRFLLPDCDIHVRVIPGDVEGLYGWIAANYLLGGFSPPKDKAGSNEHPTFGFLDMGGASAQIAFVPNATEAERHANDLTLMRLRTVDGEASEYRVFSTTWLRFGVHEARARYVETLESTKDTADSKELLDPCLPSNLRLTPKGDVFLPDDKTIDGKVPFLKGTGEFEDCLQRTQPLLEKDHVCEDDPCPVAGVHMPAVDFDVNHFVGVSEYWHTTHEIFQVGEKDKAYDFNTYQQRVSKFCSRDWQDIKKDVEKETWGDKVDEKIAAEVCFKASWLINLLHEGIGVPRVGLEETPNPDHNGTTKLLEGAKEKGFAPAFKPINKIDDTEVSWTLGKIVLYASSLIEPSKSNRLPVGFGTNSPGIPADFQYPSVQSHQPDIASNATLSPSQPKTEEGMYHSTAILSSGRSRRIPGIILFLLILCFAMYYLLNRARRKRLYSNISHKGLRSNQPSQSNFFMGKLPSLFRSAPRRGLYEQVDLEDGGSLTTPDNFELGGYLDEESSSDSSNASRGTGKSSGWASPTRTRNASSLVETGSATFNGLGQGQGLGIGLIGNAMDRSGLVGRVDSREHLAGLTEGDRKSRSGSPARRSASRLGRLVEE